MLRTDNLFIFVVCNILLLCCKTCWVWLSWWTWGLRSGGVCAKNCGFGGTIGFCGSNGSGGPRRFSESGRSFGSCGSFGSGGACGSFGSNWLIDSAWLGRSGVPTLAVSGHLLAISWDPKVFPNGNRVFDGPKEFDG